MKTIQTVIVLGFLMAASPMKAQENTILPEPLTIQEAVAIALKGNPDSAIAEQRIAQAKASAAMVESTDYPLVNLSTEYAQTNNPMYSFGNILNQGEFDDTIDFNDPGRTDNLQLKAAVNYRIYNGGQDKASKASAMASIDAMKSNLVQVQQQLGFEVVKTFHAAIQAEKMVSVRQQALESFTAALSVGQARYEAGDLLKQDLLNLELQQATASEDLILSKHSLELTKRSLLNLLGEKEGNLVLSETNRKEQIPPGAIDYHNRSELVTLSRMKDAALAELEKARGYKRPKVDTFASYQFDNGWETDGSGDSWMAGIRLNYNLYDGNNANAQVALAKTRLMELESQIQKTALALSLEVEQAKLNYQQARERLTVTEKMVGVAEEAARIARVRFKEGVILSSDLIDYETRRSDAQARYFNAEAIYQVSIANLRRVTGLDQFSI
ncbi:TolC family protein [Desulforhopalus sp. IMCC35007]|uniref:TolC family protein n=1 Tax=Desulforhopalus sp. IMCC35007 TaxID=2569543 RepID=UPI0010AE961D|nr:TolC family protein [Desulforhopalus sp. IMCC35007]TKB10617.1 TolC family protein [Desulforhopalus sp. IMCC35007]